MHSIPLTPQEKELKRKAMAAGRFCAVAVVASTGCTIGFAIEGISGYTPTDYHPVPKWADAVAWADSINEGLGRTPEEVAEIQLSTLRRG
jgi:hypothetical protein